MKKTKSLLWIVTALLLTATFGTLVSPEVKGQSTIEKVRQEKEAAIKKAAAEQKNRQDISDEAASLYRKIKKRLNEVKDSLIILKSDDAKLQLDWTNLFNATSGHVNSLFKLKDQASTILSDSKDKEGVDGWKTSIEADFVLIQSTHDSLKVFQNARLQIANSISLIETNLLDFENKLTSFDNVNSREDLQREKERHSKNLKDEVETRFNVLKSQLHTFRITILRKMENALKKQVDEWNETKDFLEQKYPSKRRGGKN